MFSPNSIPSVCTTIVLAAPRARAVTDSSSTTAAAASLWGIVTDRPPIPSARMPSTASATSPGATSKARYTQSRPSARKAALWMAGDRECRTGDPMTAASRVSGPGCQP